MGPVLWQGSAAVIVGGDFNCRPQDMEMVMLRKLLPELQDSWHCVHPDQPGCTSNAGDQGKGEQSLRHGKQRTQHEVPAAITLA